MTFAHIFRLLIDFDAIAQLHFGTLYPSESIILTSIINGDNLKFFLRIITTSQAMKCIVNQLSFIISRNYNRTGR
ncbi:hypothetical protein D3C87_859740 [compost metagenome]